MLAYLLASAAIARADEPVIIPGKRPMLLHNDRPEDLETPAQYFDTWITPNDVFFVRQHIPRPSVQAEGFRVTLSGRVEKPLPVSLADIEKLQQHTVAATLECTGDGRGFFRPRVPGIQWMRGAIGNAEWTGPRLSDVLKLASADLNAAYVTANGADTGVARTPDFIRSLPMKKALHPATILAVKMNGRPLPDLHGFPLRLIVPGWDGTSWVKWVTSLSVDAEPNNGFFMNPAYRFPKYPAAPGAPVNPSELEVIEGMPVKSYITSPADADHIPLRGAVLRGIAWAGEERVTRVDVSTDAGRTWTSASLSKEDLPFAWRLWRLNWTPPHPGYFTIMSRATDSSERTQPIVATWNPSGYLYNAMDRVGITVEAA